MSAQGSAEAMGGVPHGVCAAVAVPFSSGGADQHFGVGAAQPESATGVITIMMTRPVGCAARRDPCSHRHCGGDDIVATVRQSCLESLVALSSGLGAMGLRAGARRENGRQTTG